MSRKNKIPANVGIFQAQKLIQQTLKMKTSPEKIKKKQGRETMFFLKNIPKDLETDETIK